MAGTNEKVQRLVFSIQTCKLRSVINLVIRTKFYYNPRISASKFSWKSQNLLPSRINMTILIIVLQGYHDDVGKTEEEKASIYRAEIASRDNCELDEDVFPVHWVRIIRLGYGNGCWQHHIFLFHFTIDLDILGEETHNKALLICHSKLTLASFYHQATLTHLRIRKTDFH